MKRLWTSLRERVLRKAALFAAVCAMGGAVFTSGCGPGLVAAGGGTVGALFGLQGGGDDDKDDGDSTPSTNVVPAVVITSLTREESPAAINYTILDANNDTCTIEVEYSVNGGSFSPCFEGAGGDGTTGLSSSAGGIAHTFSWGFIEDLGPQLTENLDVRIRAHDGTAFGSWATLADQQIGNDAPTLGNIQTTGTDTVLITFDFFDQTSDPGSLELSYSIDQGQSFTPVEPGEIVGNPPTNLPTSPTGSPNQFIWDSSIALNDFLGEVFIKLVPKDQPAGYSFETFGAAVIEGPFEIDNELNTRPELALLTNYDGQSYVGSVPIEFTLEDDESDPSVVVVQYSLNGGPWELATLLNQFSDGVAGPFPTSPSPTLYSTTWLALNDIGEIDPYVNTYNNVMLRVTPGDAELGTPTDTDNFSLTGNEAPQVLKVQPLQDSGNVPVVISLRDSSSDPVSVLVEYATDGVNYTPLAAGDFTFGDPDDLESTSTGEDNVLVWDSTIQFPNVNAASVTLRVTPTDHPPGATPGADLTGSTFVSEAFPIINDPAGADPVSIDVFTTDSFGTPTPDPVVTVEPSGTAYLDREVNPGTAAIVATFWTIQQTGADYGTLLDTSGAALSHAVGSITCADPLTIADGDTFEIDDGINGPITFEFDDNGIVSGNTQIIDLTGLTTADEVAVETADAINATSLVRITAMATTGGAIDLEHEIACVIGNAVSNGGNAVDITFTGSCLTSVTQMNSGAGTQQVRYDAPATPPAGTDYVTLVCAIDNGAYFKDVKKSYRLYWGSPVSSVTVTPTGSPTNPVEVLVNGTQMFTADVDPSGAPQIVEWEVVGGSVNGTITQNGVYTAPSTVPSPDKITVRAYSVDPSVPPGETTVQVVPEPTNITVTPPAANPPAWDPPDLLLGETIAFTADVSPSSAPDGVNWRVIWNSQDWGSGNSTVGTINSNGEYTAPNTLPSPDQVQIQAVSQVKPSVFGSYTVRLVAPPPTDFDVDPLTATVTAGGAGKQFSAVNFQPANANTSVTWEIDPQVGSIDSSGFYTPPLTLSTQQTVTVTARSVPDTSVTADATVTVQPNVFALPTDVVISPDEGITTSGGQSIQFSATVSPSGASQSVTWSFVGPSFGTIDQTGLYTPGQTNIDRTVTIQAASTVEPSVSDTVDVCITGDNHDWTHLDNTAIGRGEHSTVWDSHNSRLWILGGHSELTAKGTMELRVFYIDYSGGTRVMAPHLPIGGGLRAAPNTLTATYDVDNDRIIAIIGQGGTKEVEVWALDVTNLAVAVWQNINFPAAGTDVPQFTQDHRYHCWYDDNEEEVQVLVGNSRVYRFDVAGKNDLWRPHKTLSSTGLAPGDPALTAHAVDRSSQSDYRHYFIGAEDASNGATNGVFLLDAKDWRWKNINSTGSAPAQGLNNPSAHYDGTRFWVFGGRGAGSALHSNDLYSFTILQSNSSWTQHTLASTSHEPLARGDAFFGEAGTHGTFLIGGEVAQGPFGDFWEFDKLSLEFFPFNPEGILPQGRHGAAGAMSGGEAWIYGGVCAHGVSDELWHMVYDGTNDKPVWTKVNTSGDRPPPLRDATMVYDSLNDVMILFGGNQTTGNTLGFMNAVYEFDTVTDTWTLLSPGGTVPAARHGHAACYDDFRRAMWIYGGESGTGLHSDLYMLDLSGGTGAASWSVPANVGGSVPDSRHGATLGYDSRADQLLMIGGDSSVSGPNRQLFSFDPNGGSWQPLSVSNTGADRDVYRSATIYDDECARFLTLPTGTKHAQAVVRTTNGPTWQYLNSHSDANNSQGGTGLYDPVDQRYYAVFGQRNLGGRPVGTNQFKKVDFK